MFFEVGGAAMGVGGGGDGEQEGDEEEGAWHSMGWNDTWVDGVFPWGVGDF